jgi:hypothetical protein
MISSLLDASRSNAGERLVLDAGDCEVRELLDEIIGDLEPRAQHRVLLDMPAGIQAFWDCEKIRRALYNLLDNAVVFARRQHRQRACLESHGRVRFLCTTMAIPFRRRISRRCSGPGALPNAAARRAGASATVHAGCCRGNTGHGRWARVADRDHVHVPPATRRANCASRKLAARCTVAHDGDADQSLNHRRGTPLHHLLGTGLVVYAR